MRNLCPLCVITFTIDQKLIFQSGILSSFLSFSRGSFSIEISCSEYKTLTCCCQHSFPFFTEMWCWNPLQADKYLYTWLPDLIAFCKGDGVGDALNVVPRCIVFFFSYPIPWPSQHPHLNKNMSSMLGCPQKDWSRAEGKSVRWTEHMWPHHNGDVAFYCCFLYTVHAGCLFYSCIWKAILNYSTSGFCVLNLIFL